ncbi:MAG: hypothetical protein SVR08_05115 [Spirochaetota bacterium]|nr:hypothetical protein [Spirochaetota bacterium]
MNNDLEMEFDDEVYEDEFYDQFSDEELVDEDEAIEEEGDFDSDGALERSVEMSFACEECDYRWDDIIKRDEFTVDDEDYDDAICPMCGSTNITQI